MPGEFISYILLGAKEFVMCADGDKSYYVVAFMIKNCTIIAGYIDASAFGVWFVEGMIVK